MKQKSVLKLSANLGARERDFVFAMVMKIVKCEWEAEDVTQDALLLAHRHQSSFRGQSEYGTWLYRVATTTALMHLRSRARKSREVSCSQLAEQDTTWVETMPCPEPDPAARMAQRQELERIELRMKELGSKYTKLLRLRWFEGYSERECSEKLALPLTTVKTRAFRGRRHVLSECGIAA